LNKSESIANLTAALVKAQAAFPVVPKSKEVIVQTNKGAYAFKYAPLESMLSLIRPVLAAHGLGFTQGADGDSLTTTIFHESGEWLSHVMPLPDPGSAQAYGATITYRRRYSLKAALGIETDDDNSEEDHSPKPPKKQGQAYGSTITPTTGAWDGIPVERAEVLRNIGSSIIDFFANGDPQGAVKFWLGQNLENDEKVAVWSLLESKQRSAMKRIQSENALKGTGNA
jgi:hypothetical protein